MEKCPAVSELNQKLVTADDPKVSLPDKIYHYWSKTIEIVQKWSKMIKIDQNRPKPNQERFFIMKFETGKLNKIVIKEQIEILIQKILSEIDPKFVENSAKNLIRYRSF